MRSPSEQKLEIFSDAEIGDTVQRYLDTERSDSTYQAIFGDAYFQVDKARIRRGYGWIRVPVRPSREPRRVHYMYGFLAKLNVTVADDLGINLLFEVGDPLEGYPKPATEARELVAA